MGFVLMKMTETGPTPRHMRTELNTVRRGVWLEMAKHWFVNMRGKHFTIAGAREYGYKDRTPQYLRMKRKKFGHQKPMVKTGESERATRFSGRISSTKNRGRVTMRAPKLNYRGLYEELTRISIRDHRALVNVGDRGLGKGFKNIKRRRTLRLT